MRISVEETTDGKRVAESGKEIFTDSGTFREGRNSRQDNNACDLCFKSEIVPREQRVIDQTGLLVASLLEMKSI